MRRFLAAPALVAVVTLGSILGATAWAGGSPVSEVPTIAKIPTRSAGPYGDVVDIKIQAGKSFDFAHGIGLVEGERKDSLWLMIADSTLAIGDSLTLISDEPNPDSTTFVTLISAAVKERLHRIANAKMIPDPDDVFYRLAAPRGALDCCIFGYAVHAPRSAFRAVAGRAEADLDDRSKPEIFQSCGSGDLLYPAVWSGQALTGTLLWTRGYHLDYQVESNCPGSHDSLSTK